MNRSALSQQAQAYRSLPPPLDWYVQLTNSPPPNLLFQTQRTHLLFKSRRLRPEIWPRLQQRGWGGVVSSVPLGTGCLLWNMVQVPQGL